MQEQCSSFRGVGKRKVIATNGNYHTSRMNLIIDTAVEKRTGREQEEKYKMNSAATERDERE